MKGETGRQTDRQASRERQACRQTHTQPDRDIMRGADRYIEGTPPVKDEKQSRLTKEPAPTIT